MVPPIERGVFEFEDRVLVIVLLRLKVIMR